MSCALILLMKFIFLDIQCLFWRTEASYVLHRKSAAKNISNIIQDVHTKKTKIIRFTKTLMIFVNICNSSQRTKQDLLWKCSILEKTSLSFTCKMFPRNYQLIELLTLE